MIKFLALFAASGFFFSVAAQTNSSNDQYPFRNPSLSIEARVSDLVSRLTLEEKVGQMVNGAPAIPRLGVPAHNWWNEALHGVARTGYNVTVYPQAIGMAATFDTATMYRMADYTAEEGRAIYNDNVRKGKPGGQYEGLTYWTPNINIFRDPRWGRGQETYGEDPYLTGMMGRAFVTGLQGNDPLYLKAAACAKHYAVHSGPEPSRHTFDVSPSKYDLWDTYLPAFHELVVRAKVAGVMCAYNAIEGQPCCGSDLLMTDILRNQWNFTGYVTSDCGAITDFFRFHKTHPDAESASADAVLHSTDVDCGNAYPALVKAVKDGKITEQQLDVSLKRLFTIRFRLGQFDANNKYNSITMASLESEAHKAQSLKMARQSIVLLKNEGNLLPLRKTLKKIVVLGPNADNPVTVLGNYNGKPSRIITPLMGIKQAVGSGTEVVYQQAVNFVNDTIFEAEDISNQFSIDGHKGFRADYFQNRELSGAPVLTRTEEKIDYDWNGGVLMAGKFPAENMSVRWTADYTPDKDGSITLELGGDDGYRLRVDSATVINDWGIHRFRSAKYTLQTRRGMRVRITIEYFNRDAGASVRFGAGHWIKPDPAAIAASAKDADAIIYIGGISPVLEGEEMGVNLPGFSGGDRTSIALPAVQTNLIKALKETGKPVVFVMMTGSALAIPWEADNIPAIVNAWYGGQFAGTALADVLFGDYNPAGRLPVTFYRSEKDLPAFDDYTMEGRTYRYFKGQPLFPFGYGLSYTSFRYSALYLGAGTTRATAVTATVRVTNTGKRDGEEVVQLYVSHPGQQGKAPLRALKGFKRIALKAGETKNLTFMLTEEDISLVDPNGTLKKAPGTLRISIGGSQPTEQAKAAGTVVEGTVK
ncbi:MAG: glycoside hydrolase family 3 C-terminal domain-containing protein [Williamsia sp.]|nr:glycoside hydrolase family 3 C-terminal domain-containing protein [Williamsia sp.]